MGGQGWRADRDELETLGEIPLRLVVRVEGAAEAYTKVR